MLYIYLLLVLFIFKNIYCLDEIKSVKFDYYYEIKLNEYNGKQSINVIDIYNQTIIKVSNDTYHELLYTGSGILPNNTIINLYKNNKFLYVKSKYNNTLGNNNNVLIPNRSISTNMFKLGTYIYIKNYIKKGLKNITKDGCFRVDDNNGENNKISIFTGNIPTFNKNKKKEIDIYIDFCSF